MRLLDGGEAGEGETVTDEELFEHDDEGVFGGDEVAVDDPSTHELEGLHPVELVGGVDFEAGVKHEDNVLPVKEAKGFYFSDGLSHL